MRKRVNQHRPISIGDQAADWLLRWYQGHLSIAERHAYLQWLKTSPKHVAETVRICRHYRWLKTGKLKSLIADEGFFLRAVELPPSPDLQYSEMFEAEVARAVRAYPVDTDTLVRNAREALAERRRGLRRDRRRNR